MNKIFKIQSEFLLPENFKGTCYDALKLMTEYLITNNKKINISSHTNNPFESIIENGGKCYFSYSIEGFCGDDLDNIYEDDLEKDDEDIDHILNVITTRKKKDV